MPDQAVDVWVVSWPSRDLRVQRYFARDERDALLTAQRSQHATVSVRRALLNESGDGVLERAPDEAEIPVRIGYIMTGPVG
jgi:hypothetical protein